MESRKRPFQRKRGNYSLRVDTLIERLRKIRALNCSPSDIGMDDSLEWLDKYGRAYFLIGRIGQ